MNGELIIFGAVAITIGYFLIMIYAIVWMEPDYFTRDESVKPFKEHHIIIWWFSKIIKNVIGVILILVGILMLILPGQGLLTILMGLFFIDFPGKRNFENFLIHKKSVHKTINWVREKAGKPPIEL